MCIQLPYNEIHLFLGLLLLPLNSFSGEFILPLMSSGLLPHDHFKYLSFCGYVFQFCVGGWLNAVSPLLQSSDGVWWGQDRLCGEQAHSGCGL